MNACAAALLTTGFGCAYTQVADHSSDGAAPKNRSERPRRFPGPDQAVRLDGDREACELALLVTGEVDPPENVWRTIRDDLDNIRQYSSISMPELREISYRPVYRVTSLVLVFDFGAAERIREHTYTDWDELNRTWGTRVESIRDRWDGRAEVTLATNLCVDLTAAIGDYRFLYGVSDVFPPKTEDDGSSIFMAYDDFERRYVFRDAWGTCEDGCDQSRFVFIRIAGLSPHFQERYDPDIQPAPPWWDEAREIMRQNREWERVRGGQ
ncbi:MAG: hypothetical protein KC729_05640 [Candidatus Eisenbacteria bacterium]|uniref:Uncharacterized protein n=1 Tax=Eiseniibacteriota bacterium TaxID=2212470 RepID=A0A956LYV9_UNCEI|nr:hypothetical protein [Candidatus Eisenbacteria bacterium]